MSAPAPSAPPQGRREGGPEVLHQPVLLLRPLEGEDAAGHGGQAQGEAETEGVCACVGARARVCVW